MSGVGNDVVAAFEVRCEHAVGSGEVGARGGGTRAARSAMPNRERQLGGIEDGACGERGLVVAVIALLELTAD